MCLALECTNIWVRIDSLPFLERLSPHDRFPIRMGYKALSVQQRILTYSKSLVKVLQISTAWEWYCPPPGRRISPSICPSSPSKRTAATTNYRLVSKSRPSARQSPCLFWADNEWHLIGISSVDDRRQLTLNGRSTIGAALIRMLRHDTNWNE